MDKEIQYIIMHCIEACDPEQNVFDIVKQRSYAKPPVIISIGKAAVSQARGAARALRGNFRKGLIITKYGHALHAPDRFSVYEAGHPVPDENSLRGAQAALDAVQGLTAEDTVIFLVSGGGSALFELPVVGLDRLSVITEEMLKKGCEINEINSVRKKLSAVKGGRFALACAPAKVENLLLSDVLGDAPSVIASGPAVPDDSPAELAWQTAEKYKMSLTAEELRLLRQPTPAALQNVSVAYTGNLHILTQAAKTAAEALGYTATVINEALTGEASAQAEMFAKFVLEEKLKRPGEKLAYIMGGETTVTIKGGGKGGRNQEFALAAAKVLDGIDGIRIFAFGSDGTDGPTENAGGIADGGTAENLRQAGGSVDAFLADNNSAEALRLADGLIVTGPTGTNVNDLYMALVTAD